MRSAFALVLGICAVTGGLSTIAAQELRQGSCVHRELDAHAAADTLRSLYIRADRHSLLSFLCGLRVTSSDPADSARARRLDVHVQRALEVLRRDAATSAADTTCEATVRALTCEFEALRIEQLQAIAAASSIELLLIDLLARSPARDTILVHPDSNGAEASAVRVDTVVVIHHPIIVPTRVQVRTERLRQPLAVSGAAGASLLALGARGELPLSVPVAAAFEYIEYMGRPRGVLVSAGARFRGVMIMPGVSLGAGDPVPWLSVTADTPLGLELGLLVGPALAARAGS